MKINFSAVLSREDANSAIGFSRNLTAQYPSCFVLAEETNIPHITLYAADFPEEHMLRLRDLRAELLREEDYSFNCKIKQVETHQRYIGVEIERTEKLMSFHKRIVEMFSPLRSKKETGESDYGMQFTDQQKEYEEQYGHPDVLDLWNPHFTLTRLQSEHDAQKALNTLRWSRPEIKIHAIFPFFMGENGTCTLSTLRYWCD